MSLQENNAGIGDWYRKIDGATHRRIGDRWLLVVGVERVRPRLQAGSVWFGVFVSAAPTRLAFMWRKTRRGYRFEVYDTIADEARRLYETELHLTEHDAWQDVCVWAANGHSEPIALKQDLPR